jgi:hypothetical protein
LLGPELGGKLDKSEGSTVGFKLGDELGSLLGNLDGMLDGAKDGFREVDGPYECSSLGLLELEGPKLGKELGKGEGLSDEARTLNVTETMAPVGRLAASRDTADTVYSPGTRRKLYAIEFSPTRQNG